MEEIVVKYFNLKYPEAKQFFRTFGSGVLYLGNNMFYNNDLFVRNHKRIIMELFGISNYRAAKYINKWINSLKRGKGVINHLV